MSAKKQKVLTRFEDLPDDALIRLNQILAWHIVPYSTSTFWRRCRNNEFPQPIKVSTGITAWRVGEVRRYLAQVCQNKRGVVAS